jgi:uncharacterized protein YneF (UPF0154 family)
LIFSLSHFVFFVTLGIHFQIACHFYPNHIWLTNKENEMRQRKNQKANEDAIEVFKQEMGKKYPSHDEKIRYRLWKDQDQRCAYSGNVIALGQIFSAV